MVPRPLVLAVLVSLTACGGSGDPAPPGPLPIDVTGNIHWLSKSVRFASGSAPEHTDTITHGKFNLAATGDVIGELGEAFAHFIYGASPSLAVSATAPAPIAGTETLVIGTTGDVSLSGEPGYARTNSEVFGLVSTSSQRATISVGVRESVGATPASVAGEYGVVFLVTDLAFNTGNARVGLSGGRLLLSFSDGPPTASIAPVPSSPVHNAAIEGDAAFGTTVLHCNSAGSIGAASDTVSVASNGAYEVPSGPVSPGGLRGVFSPDTQFMTIRSVEQDDTGAPADVESNLALGFGVKRAVGLADPCAHVAGTWNLISYEARVSAPDEIRVEVFRGTVTLTSGGVCAAPSDGSTVSDGTLFNSDVRLLGATGMVNATPQTASAVSAIPFVATPDGQLMIFPGSGMLEGFISASGDVFVLMGHEDDPDPAMAGRCLSSQRSLIIGFRAP